MPRRAGFRGVRADAGLGRQCFDFFPRRRFGDETHNREFAQISDDLAAALGIAAGDVDSLDPEAPNPQIRVRIQSAPVGSGVTSSNAVFTVVAIVDSPLETANRLWVHAQRVPGSTRNPGGSSCSASTPPAAYAALDTTPNDGYLDAVVARAFTVPVSSSAFTNTERRHDDDHLLLRAVHLDALPREGGPRSRRPDRGALSPWRQHRGPTSTQAQRFATTLESLNSTPVNVWNLEGKWGGEQTFQRWHVTATSIDVASYPGLTGLLAG